MQGKRMPKSRILIVDDEPDNLDLLYRTFRREYQVLRASSGPEALELLSQQSDVSVIISDQRMPRMSGTEFLSLTAAQYPDIVRILLTGYTDVDDLVDAINAGRVFRYVTKPWNEQELRDVVQQAISTHNLLQTRTRELRRSLRQESLLNAISTALRRALDYRQLLQILVETVGDIFEADVCMLKLLQGGQFTTETCFFHNASGWSPNPTLTHSYGALLAQTVWETENLQVIHDTEQEGLLQAMVDEEQSLGDIYQLLGIRSSLIIPMVYQQDLLAVLALHQCHEVRTWQEDDIQLAGLVAGQAASAVSQALAYEQVKTLAQRQALVNSITNAIRSSLEPEAIFSAITQELGEALGVDSCALSLWTEEDEYVHCVGLYTLKNRLSWLKTAAVGDSSWGAVGPGTAEDNSRRGDAPLDPPSEPWGDGLLAKTSMAMVDPMSTAATVSMTPASSNGVVKGVTSGVNPTAAVAVGRSDATPGGPEAGKAEAPGVTGSGSPLPDSMDRPMDQQTELPQSYSPIQGNPVLTRLLQTHRPVIVDSSHNPSDLAIDRLSVEQPTQSLLVVPLLIDTQLIGSISLRQVEYARQWRAADIELAQLVAAQAAIAVQQSRLYETTRKQAEDLSKLNIYLTETVLERFLPPTMVKKAAAGTLVLDLQPEPRLVTIVFTDIVGFTPLSNQLQARGIAELLNQYLGEMSQVIFANGGTIDKFIGDAVLCLFGAPEELAPEEQVQRAVATARQMFRTLARLNDQWMATGRPAVQFRCGIHQGDAVVGLFGSRERSDYTAIGPCVNIAARLQEAAKPNRILVSAKVASYLSPTEMESAGDLSLKGVSELVSAYTVNP
ncbi:GAF domain-containing protein [Prochlorothrix hollandica]|uniref:GAF domain-containing protein n=1 Tax=Prochlorothrix hollandica TaxID=1223 RepID=UPI003DA74404